MPADNALPENIPGGMRSGRKPPYRENRKIIYLFCGRIHSFFRERTVVLRGNDPKIMIP